MNKKRIVSILEVLGIIILLVIIIVFIMSKNNKNSITISPYSKYELSILVNASNEKSIEKTSVRFRYDGRNGKISSDRDDIDAYLIGEKLQYLKEETVYSYTPKLFYDDLNELISEINQADELGETGDYKRYSAVLDFKKMNKFLSALCFDRKTSSDTLVKFNVLDTHVSSFEFSLADIEGYDKVDVMLHFESLDEDYKVSTVKILGNTVRPYRYEDVRENIFTIVR